MALRPREDLPAVLLALLHDLCDLLVGVLEHLAKEEHRALDRRQRFEDQHERHRHRFGHLDLAGHRGLPFLDDGLRQPRSDVGLATGAGGSQVVDGQTGRESREVRLGRLDGDVLARPMETQEGFLDDVLGLRDAADHPIRDGERQGPVCGNLRFRRGGCGLGRRVGHH